MFFDMFNGNSLPCAVENGDIQMDYLLNRQTFPGGSIDKESYNLTVAP